MQGTGVIITCTLAGGVGKVHWDLWSRRVKLLIFVYDLLGDHYNSLSCYKIRIILLCCYKVMIIRCAVTM